MALTAVFDHPIVAEIGETEVGRETAISPRGRSSGVGRRHARALRRA